jgi:hypothetical protein
MGFVSAGTGSAGAETGLMSAGEAVVQGGKNVGGGWEDDNSSAVRAGVSLTPMRMRGRPALSTPVRPLVPSRGSTLDAAVQLLADVPHMRSPAFDYARLSPERSLIMESGADTVAERRSKRAARKMRFESVDSDAWTVAPPTGVRPCGPHRYFCCFSNRLQCREWLRTVIIRLFLTVIVLLVALFLPYFGRIMSFCGSLLSFTVSVTFPPAAYVALHRDELSRSAKVFNWGLTCFGVVFGLMGTVASVTGSF